LSKIISYLSEISQKSAKKTVEIKVVAVINSDFLEISFLNPVPIPFWFRNRCCIPQAFKLVVIRFHNTGCQDSASDSDTRAVPAFCRQL
jgi:hypothetical protein